MEAKIQLAPKRRNALLVAMMLQNFAFAIVSFAPGIALPQIVAGFNRSAQYALVGVLYSLSQTIVAPIAACLGDKIGRKWINAGSVLLMCIALLGTFLAKSFSMFIICWTLAGVCVGGFVTGPYLIMMDIFEKERWGKNSGYLASIMAAGMMLGPIVAGFIVDAGFLHAVYLLPIPFFAISVIIQLICYPNVKGVGALKFDGLGVLYLALSVTAFVIILNFGGTSFPWLSATTLVLLLVFALFLFLLIKRDTKIEQPAVELNALKNRYVLGGSLINFFYSGYPVLTAGFLVYFAQAVLRTSAVSSSTLILPQVIVSIILPQIIGPWAGKEPRRYRTMLIIMGISGAITLIGISLMQAGNSMVILYALMAVGGIGYTAFTTCITPYVSMNVPPQTIGAASACLKFSNLLGVTLCSSIFGLILGVYGANFPLGISRVFLVGGILSAVVTVLALILLKPAKSEA